jgi:phosphonopyruvate decarboxylase
MEQAMIRAEFLVESLCKAGFRLFSGTPCSFLTSLINRVIDTPATAYIGAANEGDAVAIAAGAELGGKPAVVLFQNSGLGNAVNPLTSLTYIFRLPILLIVTWRGQPDRPPDEPQHELMGRITHKLLQLMGIPFEEVPAEEQELGSVFQRALAHMRSTRTPFGLILKQGIVASCALQTRPELDRVYQMESLPPDQSAGERLDQDDVLRAIQASVGATDAVLATTGYTGRALYALSDMPNQFYMVGSMGCVSSLGLGLAKAQPWRRVVVIDGDGAVLMRMGALATLGHEEPANLVHILLDNGAHDSTGGQATVSGSVDLAAVAAACGYPRVLRIGSLTELRAELRRVARTLTFLHVRTRPRASHKLPRPDMTPAQVAERFRQWLRRSDEG